MAKITTVRILLNGSPLEGAEVTYGTYLQRWISTDADGKISASLPDDFASASVLAVKHPLLPPEGYFHGSMLIEAGGTYEVLIDL